MNWRAIGSATSGGLVWASPDPKEGPRVRIRLPPAVSPVRTTGSGATFAMGRVARRELILRSKRYPGVDRVVCSMALDAE